MTESIDHLAELTDKQKAFVMAYCGAARKNATEAAKIAGYSEESCRQMGSENLSKPYIQSAIEEHFKTLQADHMELTRNLLAEYSKIAFSNIADVAEVRKGFAFYKEWSDIPDHVKACISEVSQTDSGLRVKYHDKLKALDSMSRVLGLFQEPLKQKEGHQSLIERLANEEREKARREFEERTKGSSDDAGKEKPDQKPE